jgi:hypothetical protein
MREASLARIVQELRDGSVVGGAAAWLWCDGVGGDGPVGVRLPREGHGPLADGSRAGFAGRVTPEVTAGRGGCRATGVSRVRVAL